MRSVALVVLLAGCAGAPRSGASSEPGSFAPAISVEPAARGKAGEPYAPPSGDPSLFQMMDVFELEWAADPQIAPDGKHIVYVRRGMDVRTDRVTSTLWLVTSDGARHEPITTHDVRASSPRWSPSGDRLLFVGTAGESTQLYVRWMDSGQIARISSLPSSPESLAWSPDGKSIALTMRVASTAVALATLPSAPKGSTWAEPPVVIDKLTYRVDGQGYVEAGFTHLFVVPAQGGSARQLTGGDFHHGGTPAWLPDGRSIIIAGNRSPDWEMDVEESELYQVQVADGSMRQLTSRDGPDADPAISPDGKWLAYLGFDDERQSYQLTRLHLMDLGSGKVRVLAEGLDRSIDRALWAPDGRALYVLYDDRATTVVARVGLDGAVTKIADHAGGLSIGRPYSAAQMSVAGDGSVAFTLTGPHHPADVALVVRGRGQVRRLTRLNDDVLGHKRLGQLETIEVPSSHDQRPIQAWIVTPPGFDPSARYPLLLEIHGGPHANYGERFSAELQLMASAGYVVVYANPRGSTGYGQEFGNLIHHAYPSQDYDDLMSVVDAVVAKGYIDDKRLYVTGGSGGGTLTSWIVGKTDRFRAAVVAKPVINWYSFVLTADYATYFVRYWFPGEPWNNLEHYMKRSPLSLVGNVVTPTMLLTGEQDFRTPITEAEQLYTALKLRGVDTALVRVPGASHSIAARPSNLIAKVTYILAWFHRHSAPVPAKDAG